MTGSVGHVDPEQLFGVGVRNARQSRGWSQEALAAELAKVGINVGGQSGVARIERGERPTRLNEVVAIADFLDIDLNLDLGAYGQAARRSEGEELQAALRDVTEQLTRVEKELDLRRAHVQAAKATLDEAEREMTELALRRRELQRAHAHLSASLAAAADARMRAEMLLKEIDGE